MEITKGISSEDSKEYYYIDITTNLINTGTGVSGNSNNFTVQTQGIVLNNSRQYTVEIISFYYRNSTLLPVGVYPIILSDISENIYVNNTNSSILYKSNVFTGNNDYIISNNLNTPNFIRRLRNNTINSISISIVRSDNGQPFVFDNPADVVQITLLIKN